MTETDHYSECEKSLMALLRTLTDYIEHDWQVTDDDDALSKGANYWIFFTPGMFQPMPNTNDAMQNDYITWEILFEIRMKFKDFSSSKPDFKAFRSAIFNAIKNHRRLDYPRASAAKGVMLTTLAALDNVKYWADRPNQPRPSWVIQHMKASVLQVIPIG